MVISRVISRVTPSRALVTLLNNLLTTCPAPSSTKLPVKACTLQLNFRNGDLPNPTRRDIARHASGVALCKVSADQTCPIYTVREKRLESSDSDKKEQHSRILVTSAYIGYTRRRTGCLSRSTRGSPTEAFFNESLVSAVQGASCSRCRDVEEGGLYLSSDLYKNYDTIQLSLPLV